ncbi:MAG: hypothetical protein AAFX87_24910 [Bacteroidota bacterium]
MSTISEIMQGWQNILLVPDDAVKQQAESRAAICDTCEFKVPITNPVTQAVVKAFGAPAYKCSQCQCPIKAKVFSPYTKCPVDKWGQMSFDPETPSTGVPITLTENIQQLESFCSDTECQEIITAAETKIQLALERGVTGTKPGPPPMNYEECKNVPLNVFPLDRKIAALTNTEGNRGSNLYVSKFKVSEEEPERHDYFAPGDPNYDQIIKGGNIRKTLKIFLNDDYEGGEIYFPSIDLTIQPKKGMVLIFDNIVNGEFTNNSNYCDLPVTSGEKWIATKWIRDTPAPIVQ